MPPVEPRSFDVINPATESVYGRISLGSARDVDLAVAAARRAFDSYSLTSREERVELLESILEVFERRHDEVAEAIMNEMGAPWDLAKNCAGRQRTPAHQGDHTDTEGIRVRRT